MNEALTRLAMSISLATSRLREAQAGQGLVEYAAILSFVAGVLVVAVTYFGPSLAIVYNNITNSV